MPFPGHTPGHSGYMIASGKDSLLIWGDIIHVPEIQIPRPEVTMAFDIDPVQAEATRRRVFDMVATDGRRWPGCTCISPASCTWSATARAMRMVNDGWYPAM